MNPPPTRDELLALYKLAVEEYRYEVTLGWERQKLFIGTNVALLGVLAGLGSRHPVLVPLALVVGAVVSLLGAFVVLRTHTYYRSARAHFQALEAQLGLDRAGLGLATTPGMSEGLAERPVLPRLRVVTASVAVLVLLAALDLLAAVLVAL